jgi:TonB family protein
MTRHWLIGGSLLVHAGLGVAAFVTGIWRIERLEAPRMASIGLAVMTPASPPPLGGHGPAASPTLTAKKPPKRIARDTTQPAVRPPEATTQPETTSETTSSATDADQPGGQGHGSGDGDGPGSGNGSPYGVGDAIDDATPTSTCGNGVVEDGETCDDGNRTGGDGCSATCEREPPKPAIVPPSMLGALRISGVTEIHPPDIVKTQLLRDGRDRTVGVVKVCIDTAGHVASATLASSTKYPAYDEALLGAVRTWRYRPHTVNGVAAPACGMVTFVYAIRR